MNESVIKIQDLGKMYKLFNSPGDEILDAFGALKLFPWKKNAFHEFWALQNITLDIKKGEQIGIIGPNGAGKSTLLKLISGNIVPSRGTVEVNGKIQALMDLGSGFHPEFTGYENIRASLAYQGLSAEEIKDAEYEIADFTELGEFLNQPIKTYSSGMLARLSFTTSTVINPEILIIDEILGAGDAYFLSKSKDRMRKLIDSGASILLVSHALEQIKQFCDETIWIERGRLVQRGPSHEIIKAYEQFVHARYDRRLKAINYKKQSSGNKTGRHDRSGDTIIIRYVLEGKPGACCDISEVRLLKDGETEESISVGDVQDSSGHYQAHVRLGGNDWTKPRKDGDLCYRSFEIPRVGASQVVGDVVLALYALYDDADYILESDYRLSGTGNLYAEIWRNGVKLSNITFISKPSGWTTEIMLLSDTLNNNKKVADEQEQRESLTEDNKQSSGQEKTKPISESKWASQLSNYLTIEKIMILNEDDSEQTVFPVGSPLRIHMSIQAHEPGTYDVLPTVTIYRRDGILVSNNIGDRASITFEQGEKKTIRMIINAINLGNATYYFSSALFKHKVEESQRYDLVTYDYEFQVVGNNQFNAVAIFNHPCEWSFDAVDEKD